MATSSISKLLVLTLLAGAAFGASAATYQFRQNAKGVAAAPAAVAVAPPAPVIQTVGDGTAKLGACAAGGASNCASFAGLGLSFSSHWASGSFLPQQNIPAKTSGKWYFEVTNLSAYSYLFLGENQTACAPANGTLSYFKQLINGSAATSDVYGVALDVDGKTATIYKNGAQFQVIPLGSPNVVRVAVAANICNVTVPFSFNFGQANFVYPVPSGYNMGLW